MATLHQSEELNTLTGSVWEVTYEATTTLEIGFWQ